MALDDITPKNLAGDKYFEVKSIEVTEWHSLPNGEGKPEQEHLIIELENCPYPLVMRFKSRKPVDSLIVALITHANSIWGKSTYGR